ncbi:MAG: septum site-determining protein MinC [Hydrogenothermaceae bacterium]|nr:septum site-determining protein MinC [Hydrogenothermaceae bacterium]
MIEVKGITIPAIVIKLDAKKSVEDNISELKERLSSGIFRDSFVVVDCNGLTLGQQELKNLEEVLSKYSIKGSVFKSCDLYLKESRKRSDKKSLKIVNKTLRSGQKVEYDGSVVILGDVNPDAYVVATDSIIVMGTLRGIAQAGANGDESAVVMALKFLPKQVRIAGYITRSPDKVEEVDYPEIAYVEDDRIIIKKIK